MGLGLAALLLALSAAPRGPEVYAEPQRLVQLADGRRMNLYCTGSGGPTVILEAGWSSSNLTWRQVQPLVARTQRVCSYDRAGLGFSDPAPGPRDTAHLVADLEALLAAARIEPPYVLVGYSMGGLSMRLFADRHRQDIAGMVLVEASGEYQLERFSRALPGRTGAPRRLEPDEGCKELSCPMPGPALPASVAAVQAAGAARAAYQQTILAELVGMNSAGSAQVAASRRSYGALPLVVLTGANSLGDPDFSPGEVEAFRSVWNAMHAEMAALSSVGIHRQAPGASHLIVFQRPDLIAQAVREVSRQPTLRTDR